MKKIIMLLLITFFITGCEINSDYTLEILSDTIKESASVTLKENDYDKANYLNDVFSISTEYYDNENERGASIIKKIKTEELKATYDMSGSFDKTIKNDNITLNYNYNNDDYKVSKIFNYCFSETHYDSTDDYYAIKGYSQFKCLYKEEIKIVIKTDYRVIDSNADEINKNEYIWYFDEDNYMDHELYIQVSKQLKRKANNNWQMYVLIGIGIIFLIYKFFGKGNNFSIVKNNEV